MAANDLTQELLISDAYATYQQLAKIHDDVLGKKGVILPKFYSTNSEQGRSINFKALQLIYVYKHIGTLVSKEAVADYVKSIEPTASGDQQVRHLKDQGWDIRTSGKSKGEFNGKRVPNGYYVLASVDHCSESFLLNKAKRMGRIEAKDWTEMKAAYKNHCACCGEESSNLEQGHKDPSLALLLENSIPMCGTCNNWASNNFVFNDRGRVVKLASSKIVMDSDQNVQLAIFYALREKFEGKSKSNATKGGKKPPSVK